MYFESPYKEVHCTNYYKAEKGSKNSNVQDLMKSNKKKLLYPRLFNSQLGIENRFSFGGYGVAVHRLAQCYAPCRLFTIMILYWTSAHRIIVNYIKISSLHTTATMIMDFESDFPTYKPCDSLESIVSNFSVHYHHWIINYCKQYGKSAC